MVNRGNKNIRAEGISDTGASIEYLPGEPNCPIGRDCFHIWQERRGEKSIIMGACGCGVQGRLVLRDASEWAISCSVCRRRYALVDDSGSVETGRV